MVASDFNSLRSTYQGVDLIDLTAVCKIVKYFFAFLDVFSHSLHCQIELSIFDSVFNFCWIMLLYIK